jgi:integrase
MTVNDVDLETRMFKITKAKGGKDINLPISPQIAYAHRDGCERRL